MSAPALELPTPHGAARVHLHPVPEPVGALLLGHGAGGSLTARDLVAVSEAAQAAGWTVGLVEQPYRVAGRRSAAPAAQLDAAWVAVADALGAGPLAGLPLVTGGRSSGARVACRTAARTGSAGVLCLAFPLRPVARAGAERKDRTGELDAVEVPVLVVQGERDPFEVPAAGPLREVVVVAGTHALTSDLGRVAAEAAGWLGRLAP